MRLLGSGQFLNRDVLMCHSATRDRAACCVGFAKLLNPQAILVTQGVDDATDDRTHGFSRRIGIYIVPADWSSRGHTLREALEYPRPVGFFAAFEDGERSAEPHPAR